MQVISRSSSQFSYLSMFPGEGSLITRLYYLVSAPRVQTAASGYSSWLGSLSEVRNTTAGFKWKTHQQIRFPETGETLKAAGWKGKTSHGSTAGQHVLSLWNSTLLCLVSTQQCLNGAKWTEREGKLLLPTSPDVCMNMLVGGIQPPVSHSDLMSFSSGRTHSNLACASLRRAHSTRAFKFVCGCR